NHEWTNVSVLLTPYGEGDWQKVNCGECQDFCGCAAFQAVGVNSATRVMGQSPSLGRTSLRYWRKLMSRRRQVSTIEAMAATFGPACSLPICSQFLRPSTSGRSAPSHQLLSASSRPSC